VAVERGKRLWKRRTDTYYVRKGEVREKDMDDYARIPDDSLNVLVKIIQTGRKRHSALWKLGDQSI